jgi:serine/threonine protein kinase
MFKIVNTKDIPEIPESFSKEGKDFLSLCLKRDPAQRPSATQLLGHPFVVQDHQAIRATKCNISQLRNRLSLPAEACHKKVTLPVYSFLIDFLSLLHRLFLSCQCLVCKDS